MRRSWTLGGRSMHASMHKTTRTILIIIDIIININYINDCY